METFIKRAYYIFRIATKLGIYNFLYVIWYKFTLRLSLRKWKFPVEPFSSFNELYKDSSITLPTYLDRWKEPLIENADKVLKGTFTYFSFHEFQQKEIPNWFYDPFSGTLHPQATDHWMSIKNFGEIDIKIIWEQSRFDWVTLFARAFAVSNQKKYIDRLNVLLIDWSKNNPLNQGPNWICGQEAAIRVMKLITAAYILNQFHEPTKTLKELVSAHVKRINSNITYAIIQDNNHGTSEAAGLYIGALWLVKSGYDDKRMNQFVKKGRRILEERILKLIQKDGTFSQRSTNYHRVFLDTMSFVLHMMHLLEEPEFSTEIKDRLYNAGAWQYKMTFGKDGETPNFGSNDGAMLENLHSQGYRDFRASTQCFFALLTGKRAYNIDLVSEAMYWRCGEESLEYPQLDVSLPNSEILDNQILLARQNDIQLFLKIPEDTFRPGNDAFHLDLWVNRKPLLIDAGTYSYNDPKYKYFKSVSAHNTVQFDNHEQMPVIGRFLNAEWIVPDEIGEIKLNDNAIEWEGNYTDYKKNIHKRSINISPTEVVISDTLNSKEDAVIRYHFMGETKEETFEVSNGMKTITKSYHSLYYKVMEETRCLEIQPVDPQKPVILKIKLER